jgi:raffinose/stachyose/melibiose transport system permease protein
MDTLLRDKKAYFIFVFFALLVFVLTVLVPIVWSLVYSLFEWDGISAMEYAGLANYKKLINSSIFWLTVKNNMIYTVICIVLKTTGGMLLALLLYSKTRGRELFKTLYFIPAILSTVVVTQLFQQIYAMNPEGLLNALLRVVGLQHLARPWLSDSGTALIWVSFVDFFKYTPMYMLIFFSALMAISKDVLEAARMDGASGWRLFKQIKLPLIKSTVIAALILMISGTLKEFDIPYLLTGGGPGHATEMVTTHMYKVAFSSMQYGYGSAIAFFIVVECLLIVGIFRKSILSAE